MSNELEIRHPLVEVGKAEEAVPEAVQGLPGLATPAKAKNYAEDPDTVQYIQNELVTVIMQTRWIRQPLEQEWNAIRNMTAMKHDDGQKYKGKSNVYLPVWAKNEETLVTQLSRGLFPSDDFLDVSDETPGAAPESAKPLKAYMEWEVRTVSKLPTYIKPFLRQLVRYGNSVLKAWYAKELRYEGRSKRAPDISSIFRADPDFKHKSYEGLRVSTRNIYNWYIYPMTAEKIDDAVLIFEDIQTPRQVIESHGRSGRWANIEDALNSPTEPQQQSNEVQLFDANNMSAPTTQLMGTSLGDVRTITECWLNMKLPKAAYNPGEDPECPVPCRVTLAGNTVLEVTRNPFWHQRPPYLAMTTVEEPGLFYGSGPGRKVRQLQYLANDFANQTNDNGMFTLNPIVKYNPALIAGPLRPMRPGVAWPMHDIKDGVAFDRPPAELIQYGTALMQMYIGMAQDAAGAPPVLQGTGGGGAAKTATGTQVLQRNAMSPLQDLVEDIENQVMIPLLDMAWVNAQQFREKDVMATVAGMPILVTPADLAIDAKFRWMASTQAANQAQRAQQGMMFLQAIMGGPVIQLLMQQGKMVDIAYLLGRIWSDGFGFRGFDKVIQQMPMAPPGMPGAPMPGAPGQAPGDVPRSTVDQAPGGGTGDMVPGEGEDFMNVRAEADQMASDAGENYGV